MNPDEDSQDSHYLPFGSRFLARYEPSHLDLHCLQKYLLWSAMLKGTMSENVYPVASLLVQRHSSQEDQSR